MLIILEMRLAQKEKLFINKTKIQFGNHINEKKKVISKYLENKY